MKKISKILSGTLVLILIVSMCAIGMTSYAVSDDVIGDYKFNITSTYDGIDWDTYKQYKSATHVHTVRSDADTEVNDMIEYYYKYGFDAMALTDHGTVNYGWTSGQSRVTIFDYQFFVHGAIDELSSERYTEITTGTGAISGGTTARGYGMREIPLGIELNGMSTAKCHINGFYTDYGHGDLGTTVTWPRDSVAGNYNAGGLTHINHVGEWSDGKDDIGTYDADFVSDFASIYQDYGIMKKGRDESNLRGCLGMELVNTADSRTRNDRYLYDQILKILAPQGINVLAFCEDDAHEESDCDRNAQYFIMPENDMATNNIKHSMMYGEFYACSKNSKNSYELGDGFSASGAYPYVSYVGVDDSKNQIIITSKNANKIRIVADGEIIDTNDISTSGETTVFDLNKYENKINSYVRIYLTGPGGILYLQPFLVEKESSPVSTVNFIKPSSDTEVVVYNAAGSLVSPANTSGQYILDAGDYTYVASRPGYITTDPIPFTVTQSEIDNGTKRNITVTLEEDSSVVYTHFYVPETIYLSTADSMTFSSYVDRENADEGPIRTCSSTTGNIYFHRKGATNVDLTYEIVEGTSLSSMTIGSVHTSTESLSTSITSGKMSSALASGGHSVIKWTATYTSNGKRLTSNAYTYIYGPLKGTGSVAAAGGQAKTKKNVLGWAHTTMHITATVWLAGVQSVSGGSNGAYSFPYYGCVSDITATDASSLVTAGVGMTTASDESSGGSVTVSPVGGTGKLTIDTSRYTNLNQIPNLVVGLDINNCTEGSDVTTSYISVGGNNVFTRTASMTDSNSGDRFVSGINWSIDTTVTSLAVIGYASCVKSSRTDAVNGGVILALNYVDKSELREQYNKAIKLSYQSDWFDDEEDYNSYVNTVKSAGIVLGNPTASASDISNAITALGNMLKEVKLKDGTLTIKHIDKTNNTVLATTTETYKICDTIIASAEDFVGYDYSNITCVSNGVTTSTTNETFISLMSVDDNYIISVYYTPKQYTVQYIVSDSSFAVSEETVTYGKSYTITNSIPVQTGYTFDGWYLEANGNIYQPGDSFIWSFEKNSALTAQWDAKKFTASYDLNGGSGLDNLKEKIAYMDSFTVTDIIPEKEGYIFSGWLAETASGIVIGTYTSGSSFSWDNAENVTLTAQWMAISVNVSFENNGGTLSTDKITVKYGEEYGTLPVPEKEGNNFDGWFLDSKFTYPVTSETIVNTANDHTLYAKWSKGQYKITYYVDGKFYTETSYNYGETIVPKAAPAAEGYTFSGWSEIPATMPAYNVTVNGTLTAKSYTLKYVIDGKTYSESEVKYGTSITAPVPEEKDGYTFSGWDYVPATMPAKNVTVTSSYNANEYSLYYYVDGTLYTTETYEYGAAITPIQMASKTGYSFSGWSGIPTTMPAKNVYANGSYNTNKYKLTYYVDGSKYYEAEYEYKQPISAYAEPEKEGYTFSGWSYIPETMPSRDFTVNGSFTANEYSYFFNVNGELRSDLTIKAKFGDKISAPEISIPDTFTFSGWSPVVPETMGSQSMTFYGTTTKVYSTITFSLNGGAGTAPNTEKYAIGSTVDIPSKKYFRTGYVFCGWSENSSATSGQYSFTLDERDITLYAVWYPFKVRLDPAVYTKTVVDDNNNIIFGVQEGITQSDFINNYVEVVGENGRVEYENGIGFGTGSKVKLYENDVLVKTYQLVVYGDVDGDGVADGMDVQLATMIKDGILTKSQVGEAVWEAADCNHDGSITDEDIRLIINSGVKLQVVDQIK